MEGTSLQAQENTRNIYIASNSSLSTGKGANADCYRSVLDFALRNSAIIVNPDYRLLPEATGNEILDDVSDFWAWLRGVFVGEMDRLGTGIAPDLHNILVRGESAGEFRS